MKKKTYKVTLVYGEKTYSLKGEDAKHWIDIMTRLVESFSLEKQLPGFKWEENDNNTN